MVSSTEGRWHSAAHPDLEAHSASQGEPCGQHTAIDWLALFPAQEAGVKSFLGSSAQRLADVLKYQESKIVEGSPQKLVATPW